MNTECSQLRILLGVYVLGAIEPAERAMVDAHLSVCQRCRDELASLACLPAMLGRVTEDQIAQLAPPADTPMLDLMLAKAAREKRLRRRRNRIWLAVAAAALVVVTGVSVGVVTHESAPSGVTHGPTPFSAFGPMRPGPTFTGWDSATGVRAKVNVQAKRWGTALDVVIGGQPRGDCQLVAVDRNGRSDIAGTWWVPGGPGNPVEYFGSSRISRDNLASVEVRTLDGRRLIRIPV